jgi:hypothetical protein
MAITKEVVDELVKDYRGPDIGTARTDWSSR